MHLTRDWAAECKHPSPSALFSLPNAVYFLLKFRPDLASFEHRTIEGRMTLYFWWKAYGERDYPDFEWVLDEGDVAYARQLNATTLIDTFPQAVSFWLAGHASDVLDEQALLAALLEGDLAIGPTRAKLPRLMSLLVQSRADLRAHIDLGTFSGQLAALIWWETHGRLEYPRLSWSPNPVWHSLNELGNDNDTTLIDVPRFLAPLVDSRPDLRREFDLATFSGRFNMLLWWGAHGKREYPRLVWSAAKILDRLNEFDDTDTRGLFRVPQFLPLLVEGRPDLRPLFDLDTFRGRLDAMRWWAEHGQREYPSLRWHFPESLEDLMRAELVPGAAMELPRFLLSIRESKPNLIADFDITTTQGALALISWWHTLGRGEYPLLQQLCIAPPESGERPVTRIDRSGVSIGVLMRPFGVNIVGFPQGVLGLGEDARMAAQAMQLGGFDAALINAPMSGPPRLDTSMNHLLRDDLAYQVSLFCLPPPEMVRLALEGGRRLIESDTYKIGAWPWELPHWPGAFGRTNEFVDEIWAQSHFVEAVYARLGKTRVRHMPMAVVVPKPQPVDRKRFGLPADDFLFYLMFDGNSWLTRKNPVAGVMAFKQAFAKETSGVGLVIKAMNVRDDDPTWRQVRELAAADDRIHIVSERLSRQDTIDFMASCNAYISLHRSEGFGRVIAEAMALGQPVVATNFSGNVDFCDAETAFLVDGELVPLRPGDYLFHEGQYWCDPDIGIAASQLERVFGDAGLRERIAKAGRARIEQDYSMAAVARAYEQRLNEIRQTVSGS